MVKCDCYRVQPIFVGWEFDRPIYKGTRQICIGTKECDETNCNGDQINCKFYPDVRQKAIESKLDNITIDEKDELLFYRHYIVEHNMIDNVLKEYKKWKKLKEPVYPCNECKTGWGRASSEGVVTCNESCEKLKKWAENMKGGCAYGT